jgi:hypothetical protein
VQKEKHFLQTRPQKPKYSFLCNPNGKKIDRKKINGSENIVLLLHFSPKMLMDCFENGYVVPKGGGGAFHRLS